MQPNKDEPPAREKISLTDHLSTTPRDFQINEEAQMGFAQDFSSKPAAGFMSTTSVSFIPTIQTMHTSPILEKPEA
jgi:hypothetical protein